MFSTIRLLLPRVALCPASMPPRKAHIIYGPTSFTCYAAWFPEVTVTLHNQHLDQDE